MAYQKIFATKPYIAKEIADGVLTLDDWGICYHVDGEGSAADDLITITGGIEGQFLIIKSDGVTLTIKHGTGNISLAGGSDFTLTAEEQLFLIYDGANWLDIQTSGVGDFVPRSLYDADSVVAATDDNTPVAIAMGAQTVLGRITGGHPAALTVAQLQTLLFSAIIAENVSLDLDEALSADGEYTGICINGTAGATLAFGDVCYLASADGRWELAKADAEATAKAWLGICVLAAASDGEATKMLLIGTIRADTAFPDLTKGAPVYLDYTNAGDVLVTMPAKATGRIVRILGYGGLTANEMFFFPENDYVEYV